MISGLRWVLDTVHTAADAELNDDTALREQLLEAEMRREMGEISDEEFGEIEADLLIKATNVDGVYSADPQQDPTAEFLPELTFQEAIVRRLRVMDANAFGLCKENSLPIVIMNVNQQGAIARVLRGERVGTLVR